MISGTSTTTTQAPSANLVIAAIRTTRTREGRAEQVGGERGAPSPLAVAQPVRDHPALGQREGEEHTDREQRDQRRV